MSSRGKGADASDGERTKRGRQKVMTEGVRERDQERGREGGNGGGRSEIFYSTVCKISPSFKILHK